MDIKFLNIFIKLSINITTDGNIYQTKDEKKMKNLAQNTTMKWI